MGRTKSIYVCQKCGETSPKWVGQCVGCGTWNSYIEELFDQQTVADSKKKPGKNIKFSTLAGHDKKLERIPTQISEFDRVCGGGLVPGTTFLVGGDPGIGKSTLMLQVVGKLANINNDSSCIYFSGEEGVEQVRLRGSRLNLSTSPVNLASTTSLEDITYSIENTGNIGVVVIDSIQTLHTYNLNSTPGTVAQVRACAQMLIQLAKSKGFVLFLIGHVTKDGTIAGPKILEHMVDTVLYFEGERNHQYRILRAVKNRFGAIDEIGVFEMKTTGLHEISNPSALFIRNQGVSISGTAVFSGMEGGRPMLIEIQALTSPTTFGTPRRAVVGWDTSRLNMILAVLESRCNFNFREHDVYLNIAGGIRITEPAADLAVSAALISSFNNTYVPKDSIFFGEVGLSGEIRSVGSIDARLKEATKLGFSLAIIPTTTKSGGSKKTTSEPPKLIKTKPIRVLGELLEVFQN